MKACHQVVTRGLKERDGDVRLFRALQGKKRGETWGRNPRRYSKPEVGKPAGGIVHEGPQEAIWSERRVNKSKSEV